MTKLKIAFDPLKNWDIELFRDVMRSLSLQIEKYDLYIITAEEEDQPKIDNIATLLNIPTSNVFYGLVNTGSITDQLSASKIDIYLTGFMDVFNSVGSSTTTIPILVNSQLQDLYQMNPKWFQTMEFWIGRLNRNEQENC